MNKESDLVAEILTNDINTLVEDLNNVIKAHNVLLDRINKAIEYIENYMPYVVETDKEYEDVNGHTYYTYKEYTGEEIIKILKGE